MTNAVKPVRIVTERPLKGESKEAYAPDEEAEMIKRGRRQRKAGSMDESMTSVTTNEKQLAKDDIKEKLRKIKEEKQNL